METINGESVATNPNTGEQRVYRGNAWVPYTKSAAPAAPDAAPAPSAAPTPDTSDPSAAPDASKPADAAAPPDAAAPKYDPSLSSQAGNMWENLKAFGKYGEDVYEKYPGRWLNKGGAMAVTQVMHPEWSLHEGVNQILKEIHTPYEQLNPLAREISESIMPQDIASAELMALGWKYPGIEKARTVGDVALGPLEKAMSSRWGRTATATGIGGLTGAITGTGGLAGAAQGLLGFGGPELAGKGIQARGVGEAGQDALRKSDMAKFGKALQDRLPWLGKIQNTDDFKDLFVRGGAVKKAGQILTNTKNILKGHFGNHLFDVPDLGILQADGTPFAKKMTFDAIDKLRSDLQQGYGFTIKGAERAGANARIVRKASYDLRDVMAAQMDKFKNGLGRAYKNNLSQFDFATEFSKVFTNNQKALFHPKFGLNQPELIDRLDTAATKLDRSMGPNFTKDILNVVKRGFVGNGKDLPKQAFLHAWLNHAIGHAVGGAIGGLSGWHYGGMLGGAVGGLAGLGLGTGGGFSPAGEVPWSMRPSMGKGEAILSQQLGNLFKGKPTIPQAIYDAQKTRAQNVAGPHASADRVSEIQSNTQAIARGESPNVQHDLETHNLSMGNVRKMLDNSNTTVQTAFNDLSPSDAIAAFSRSSKDERQALLPALAQHLQNTAGQMQPQQRQQMMAQLQAAMTDQGAA